MTLIISKGGIRIVDDTTKVCACVCVCEIVWPRVPVIERSHI